MIRLYANNKHTDIIETKKIKNFDRNKSKFPYDAFVHTGYDENSVKIFEPAAILAISDDYDTLSKPVKRWTKPNKRNFEKKESVQEAEKSMGQKVDLLNFENLYSEKVDEKDIMIAALQKQFRDMEKKLQSNEKSKLTTPGIKSKDIKSNMTPLIMKLTSMTESRIGDGSHETPTSLLNISSKSLSALNRSHERKRLEKRTPEQSADFSKSKKKKIASENDSHDLTPIIRGGSRVVRKSLQGFRKTLMSQSNSPISTQMPDLSNSHIPESDKDEESDSSIVSIKKKNTIPTTMKIQRVKIQWSHLQNGRKKALIKRVILLSLKCGIFILEYLFH
ncbi:hypothetical protein TKK_0010228 [Trichogramma kaykai]